MCRETSQLFLVQAAQAMGRLWCWTDPSGWSHDVIKCPLNNQNQSDTTESLKGFESQNRTSFRSQSCAAFSCNDGKKHKQKKVLVLPAFATFNFFCCLLSSPPQAFLWSNVVKIHPRNTVQDLVGQIWTTSLTLILEYVECIWMLSNGF